MNALGPGLAAGVDDAIATACGEVTVVAGGRPFPIRSRTACRSNIFGGQAGGEGTITAEMLDYIQPRCTTTANRS